MGCGILGGWDMRRVQVVRMATAAAFFAAGVVSVGTANGQSAPAAGQTKTLTPEASLNVRSISDLQYSPDGTRLALVVTEPPKGTGRKRHVWVYEKETKTVRQFTFSAKSESAPRWSPDGKQLAFLSDRGEEQQIYVMRLDGGEGIAVTKGKRGVSKFEWSPDGKGMAFVAPDAKTDAEEKKEKDKDDARVADKDEKRARLWLVEVATGETRALTKASWEVDEVAWAPGGEQLYVKATERPESDQNTGAIYSVAVSDGTAKKMLAPRGPFGELRVSPNGSTVSFVGSREDGPEPHDLELLAINGRAARNLTGASLDRPVEDYHWEKDGAVVMVAANGFGNLFVKYGADGVRQDLGVSPMPSGGVATSGDGEIAYVSQNGTTPQEVWAWDRKSAAAVQISHLNDAWKQVTLSTPEYYKYKSFDGVEIEAALLRPQSADSKGKLPLIALIHGGPTGRWSESIETWGQLLAARGYAVFYPNIRGSVGYGQKFVESNRGDWGGGDFKDVMAGVKDLVDRGIADPARLGIGGWSYGGYMAEWAITQTNDFKAAVSGAGMANLISEFGMEDHPAGDEWFYGVPWEKPEGFLNGSPFLHFKSVKTPTLVLQGDADTIDPLGQSQELYRGLKRYGVETELVVYPREPHGFHEEKHLVDRLNRILAWYDKYLKPKGSESAEK
jgi:dipeptidyl aminopeptidase/acylaminoacyl peptidase